MRTTLNKQNTQISIKKRNTLDFSLDQEAISKPALSKQAQVQRPQTSRQRSLSVRAADQNQLLCLKQVREKRKLQQLQEQSQESRRERSFSVKSRNPSEARPLREMLSRADASLDVERKFGDQLSKIEELESQIHRHKSTSQTRQLRDRSASLEATKLSAFDAEQHTQTVNSAVSSVLTNHRKQSVNQGWLNIQHEAVLGRIEENPRESLMQSPGCEKRKQKPQPSMSSFVQKQKAAPFPLKSGARTTRNGKQKAVVKVDLNTSPNQTPVVVSNKSKDLRPQTSLAKQTFSFTKPPTAKREASVEAFDLVQEMMKPVAQMLSKEETSVQKPQRPKTSNPYHQRPRTKTERIERPNFKTAAENTAKQDNTNLDCNSCSSEAKGKQVPLKKKPTNLLSKNPMRTEEPSPQQSKIQAFTMKSLSKKTSVTQSIEELKPCTQDQKKKELLKKAFESKNSRSKIQESKPIEKTKTQVQNQNQPKLNYNLPNKPNIGSKKVEAEEKSVKKPVPISQQLKDKKRQQQPMQKKNTMQETVQKEPELLQATKKAANSRQAKPVMKRASTQLEKKKKENLEQFPTFDESQFPGKSKKELPRTPLKPTQDNYHSEGNRSRRPEQPEADLKQFSPQEDSELQILHQLQTKLHQPLSEYQSALPQRQDFEDSTHKHCPQDTLTKSQKLESKIEQNLSKIQRELSQNFPGSQEKRQNVQIQMPPPHMNMHGQQVYYIPVPVAAYNSAGLFQAGQFGPVNLQAMPQQPMIIPNYPYHEYNAGISPKNRHMASTSTSGSPPLPNSQIPRPAETADRSDLSSSSECIERATVQSLNYE